MLQNNNGDSTVAAAEVGITLPFWVPLQQSPSGFVGDAPVFAGYEGAKLAAVNRLPQVFLQFRTQSAAYAAGTVAVNQFDGHPTEMSGLAEFVLQAQTRALYGGQALFEIDDS